MPGVDVMANQALQRDWYGEAVGDAVHRASGRLAQSQAALSRVLGLSAPMLSQLVTGQRAKIANPTVLARLRLLMALADSAELATMDGGAVQRRLTEIAGYHGEPLSGTQSSVPAPVALAAEAGGSTGAAAVQAVLREIASAEEIGHAADLLDPRHPELAEFLRVYGTGRSVDARGHYARWTQV